MDEYFYYILWSYGLWFIIMVLLAAFSYKKLCDKEKELSTTELLNNNESLDL